MNKEILSQAIQAKLATKGFKPTKQNQDFIETIAECIIEHIQTQAIVNVITTGTPTNHTGTGKIV